jgi:hypothetical protein
MGETVEIMPMLSPCPLQPLNLEHWLGLATLPVLAGLVAIQQAEYQLDQLGQLAESLFHGEQLPILDGP